MKTCLPCWGNGQTVSSFFRNRTAQRILKPQPARKACKHLPLWKKLSQLLVSRRRLFPPASRMALQYRMSLAMRACQSCFGDRQDRSRPLKSRRSWRVFPCRLPVFSWHTGERISDSEYAIGKVREGWGKSLSPLSRFSGGCPMSRSARLFDDQWEQKYIQCSY